jgi:hypothetical protein
MTLITNLTFNNASIVFTSQNAYTSMEFYYAIIGMFMVFVVASFFLDGQTRPFEKLFSAIIGFIFAVLMAITSFSLAKIATDTAGFFQIIDAGGNITQTSAIVPVIIMQNSQTWQVISWIIVLLCFVNIINCILVLIDYSRIRGVKKGAF